MGLDYALVHVKYTIPPCLVLTLLYRPIFTRLDLYKIAFLVAVAVISTIPWDSYLIHNNIWTYPPDAVLGPTLFRIPIEELFFFVIQTYGTSLLYIIISRPTFKPACLPHEDLFDISSTFLNIPPSVPAYLGRGVFTYGIWKGNQLIQTGGAGTYMGLISSWASPFLLLLWHLSCSFALRLPISNIVLPIAIPTLYLWIVDTFALRRGTWVIVKGTKLGVTLWEGLEIEEAFFFLVTNCMIVFGLIAFDYATTLLQTFPEMSQQTRYPSPVTAVKVLVLKTPLISGHSDYDVERIKGLNQAIDRLQRKSRSFYLASATFDGEVRTDLILLYSFCRVADDLVDQASSREEAAMWVDRLRDFLEATRSDPNEASRRKASNLFPREARRALVQLPLERLTWQPLFDLLQGFKIDLRFGGHVSATNRQWPIENVAALMEYGHAVAGTVAELCLDLAFHHHGRHLSNDKREDLKRAGNAMGKALQTVNIARDIQVDAAMGRVYIPTEWLQDVGLKPADVVNNPTAAEMPRLRSRLLETAFGLYDIARPSIEELPVEVRGPMRVAVESYMEIGRVLRDEGYRVQPGRATLSYWRRVRTAFEAING